MKRFVIGLALLATLSGCGVFGGGEKKTKTALLGERIPILTAENSAEIDPALADAPVVLPEAVVNGEWTQPGGNAAKSMGALALGQNIAPAWSVRIAGSSTKARLAAAPVVADGKVFAIDTDGVVHAFATTDGKVLWTAATATGKKSESSRFGGGVSYENGRLYATNGLGDVVALDATNGSQLWKVHPGGPLRGSPTIANDTLYVVSQDNQLFALKTTDGSTVWNEAGTLELAGVFGVAAPAAAQGTVVAGFSSGELNAYRYENGRGVWQDALSRTSISTAVASLSDIDADPVIDGGRVYAVGQGGRMVALELTTGQRLWEVNVAGISTPWVVGDWLYVVTDESKLMCIARTTGKVKWLTQLPRYRDDKPKKGTITWTGPVLAGDRLILASSEGQLANVSPADGRLLSTGKAGAPVFLPPVVANQTLFLLDNQGHLTAWR
ncbi:PQQ-binding-like beta-propeller repeat protein [Sphingomonas solaris]|uniref:PQQ-binding-like beta-propeller repeat protein n=1 Tax=Alterirhizorhabdus solaris TaxID=2529389 RepID=A0A558R9U0_9SPHN|nr:PQQ-binding-like beta-propeller repeat protein [Sphingomonas solaris]TVV76144.1 PQQ-binding-like beta-propeller repeat protein [Sphingomonas solaris]